MLILEVYLEIETEVTCAGEVEHFETTQTVLAGEGNIGIHGSILIEVEEVASDERERKVLALAEEVAEGVAEAEFTETEVRGVVNVVRCRTYRKDT